MATHRRGFSYQLGRLDLITSAALMVLAVLGLVVTGLLSELVDLLETYPSLPFVATLITLVAIFLTSETRDPSRYALWEKVLVFGSAALIADHSYQAELGYVDQYFGAYDPWTQVALLIVLIVAGAVLAK